MTIRPRRRVGKEAPDLPLEVLVECGICPAERRPHIPSAPHCLRNRGREVTGARSSNKILESRGQRSWVEVKSSPSVFVYLWL